MAKGASYRDWGLVLVRVASGLMLCLQGWGAFQGGVDAQLVESASARFAEAPAPYAWIAENVFLRAPTAFAQLLVWGALLCGACLFFGMLTRPAGCIAAFGLANVYLAGVPEQRPFVLLLAICCLACALSRAGRILGADSSLDPLLPGWLTWVRRERDMFG